MSTVSLRCETCRAPLFAEASFCEECGARTETAQMVEQSASDICASCGAPAGKDDGYCPVCGVREAVTSERSEINLGFAAAVSDQGLVHRRNDDAFYLKAFGTDVVAVVCDGVSTSVSADLAARRAAHAAGVVLAEALGNGVREWGDAVAHAMIAAHDAVEQLAPAPRPDLADPACTLVSAVCRDGELVVGWLGDSRAYWLTGDEAIQLTTDNSWAAEQVAAGMLSAEAAAADPRARSITRWVGTDAPEAPPQIVTFSPAAPGLLLLCSDGLWNYAPRPSDLARLVRQLPAAASPLAIARWLAESALKAGGHDNVTVAVVDVRRDGRQTQ